MNYAMRILQAFVLLLIFLTSGNVSAFSLNRIELYFHTGQKQNEVMVQRNHPGLRAYARIYYTGSGTLRGYWQVDGRIIEQGSRFVPAGGKITLVTPKIPGLPTFNPGYHVVRYIVTDPATPFGMPEVVYWVHGGEDPAQQVLVLTNPPNDTPVAADFIFEWEKTEKAAVYMISFAKGEGKKAFFSALTREAAYRLPPAIVAKYLQPGRKYFWSVKGYDQKSTIITKSAVQSFLIKPATPR